MLMRIKTPTTYHAWTTLGKGLASPQSRSCFRIDPRTVAVRLMTPPGRPRSSEGRCSPSQGDHLPACSPPALPQWDYARIADMRRQFAAKDSLQIRHSRVDEGLVGLDGVTDTMRSQNGIGQRAQRTLERQRLHLEGVECHGLEPSRLGEAIKLRL